LKNKLTSIVAALLILCSLQSKGQEPVVTIMEVDIGNPMSDVIIPSDTIEIKKEPVIVHTSSDIIFLSDTTDFSQFLPIVDFEFYKKHSPTKATMMSAVVPGLGQFYNGKYWKIPIVYAAVGISIGVLITWQNEYNRYRRAYIDILDNDPYTNYHTTIGFPDSWNNERRVQYITQRKDKLRGWRDWSIVAVVATYALNIIDANVDAHLMDFNIDDNLSLNIRPSYWDNSFDSRKIGFSISLNF